MKIAFLVLCHKEPLQINMLLEKCLEFDSELFIHIDKKNYQINDSILHDDRIHILDYEKSLPIYWGYNTMIHAELLLLKEATEFSRNNNIIFDYFWLMSGQDFFIMNKFNIIKELSNDKSKNYIDVLNPSIIQKKRFLKRVETKYPQWKSFNSNNLKSRIFKNAFQIVTGGRANTFKIFKRKLPFKEMYFGSQWWILNTDFSFFVLDYLKSNHKYVDFYDNSLCSDESFFQTLIMNSAYKNTISDCKVLVNFINRNPKVFSIDDLNYLKEKSKDYFLARKFDFAYDREIINTLSKCLGENNVI